MLPLFICPHHTQSRHRTALVVVAGGNPSPSTLLRNPKTNSPFSLPRFFGEFINKFPPPEREKIFFFFASPKKTNNQE